MESTTNLKQEIQSSKSASIVGFFLDAEEYNNVDHDLRTAALEAAARLVNDPATNEKDTNYLHGLLDNIAEKSHDDLQDDVKELLMSWADDSKLAEIALDEDEDTDIRMKAVGKMTDKNLLLDVAADSEDENVRQAAKRRIKELR